MLSKLNIYGEDTYKNLILEQNLFALWYSTYSLKF